jgi:hypothetical protein
VQVARLLDFSPPAIRALINEPIVEDTSGIDRGQSALLPDTWPTWERRRFSHWWLRFRVLAGVDEQTRASNAAAALFYALPLLVLFTAAWLRRYLPEPVTGWRLALFALVGLTTALGLMRSPYDVRAVDNVVIPAILFGFCVAAFWHASVDSRIVKRWLIRGVTAVLVLLVVKSVAVAGQFGDRVSYLAGDWSSMARAGGAWADVQARLTAQPPLKYWAERSTQQSASRGRDGYSFFGPRRRSTTIRTNSWRRGICSSMPDTKSCRSKSVWRWKRSNGSRHLLYSRLVVSKRSRVRCIPAWSIT